MENEKQFSEEESLKLITRTIYEAQGYFYENGMSALVYGFSILILSVLTFLKEQGFISFPFHPFWLVTPVILIQARLQYKEDKKKKAKTFTDEAIDYVWMGYMISAIAAWCANFAGLEYVAILVLLFLTGFATFLTGMIAKFRYQIICGCICWVFAVCSFFILNPAIYLLLGATAVIVFVVPGFILRNFFKKQQHAAG